MDKQISYIDDYLIHGQLGDGGQANVYLCSKNKQLFAAKVYLAGTSKAQAFKKQVQFLKKLNYKYLINVVDENLQGKVKLPEKALMIRPVIFLEYAEKGELFHYIIHSGKFSDQICRSFFKMLVDAIHYLHIVGVTHRDLKPENILFDQNYFLRVSDFGLSTLSQGPYKNFFLYTCCGTEGFRPPQMEEGDKYIGLQVDLFAAGVILFMMYTGYPPFLSTKKTDGTYRLIRKKQFNKFWHIHQKSKKHIFPDSLKRLFNCFFSVQIDKRPTFQTLRQDEWLNENQAPQNDIKQQMSKRYQIIVEKDEKLQKIEKVKVQLYQNNMLLQKSFGQNSLEKKEEGIRQGSLQTRKSQQFYISFPKIQIKELPLSQKHQIVSTKVAPSIIVAWLQNFISEAYKTKNIFMKQSCFTIEPQVYKFNYNQQEKCISISLLFNIKDLEEDNEDNGQINQLSINGQLVRLKDEKVSIEWQDGKGNAFWLYSLIEELNSQIKILG